MAILRKEICIKVEIHPCLPGASTQGVEVNLNFGTGKASDCPLLGTQVWVGTRILQSGPLGTYIHASKAVTTSRNGFYK